MRLFYLHEQNMTPRLVEIPEGKHRIGRGDEIQYWLDHHKNEYNTYVILDDDSDMLPSQLNNFVQTDPMNGFLLEHYMAVKKILTTNEQESPDE